jgi:hypothetical protein
MYINWFAIVLIFIWTVSGIVSMITKKNQPLQTAAQLTLYMGIGYFLSK